MPRLRPPQGRQAAAVVEEPIKKDDELELEADGLEEELETPELEPDPTVALKAQIDALRKSEREANVRVAQLAQEKEEALRRAQEREAEVGKLQEQTVNSQAEAIEAALAGAQAEAEAAQGEIEMAAQLGDMAAQSKAYRKLARAEANILALENGKSALERQIKETPKVEVQQQQQQGDPLDKVQLPPLAKQWLRNHPEYLYDARKNAKIQTLHWDVVDEGHEQYSAEYFEALEQKLGMRQAPILEDDEVDNEPPAPVRKSVGVSAPPSRETPNSSGKRNSRITLSAQQKEAAKIAGISEEDYAKNLMKLNQEKANGNYGGAP